MTAVVTRRLTAAGFSTWIPLNWRTSGSNYAVGLGVVLSSGASLTYSVQHTFDRIYTPDYVWSAAQTASTAVTVTKTNHGLSVDDWLLIDPPAAASHQGIYSVATVVDANSFTFTSGTSTTATTASGVAGIHTARLFPHSTLAAKTVSADGNYAFPAAACRLIITTFVSGFADLTVYQA